MCRRVCSLRYWTWAALDRNEDGKVAIDELIEAVKKGPLASSHRPHVRCPLCASGCQPCGPERRQEHDQPGTRQRHHQDDHNPRHHRAGATHHDPPRPGTAPRARSGLSRRILHARRLVDFCQAVPCVQVCHIPARGRRASSALHWLTDVPVWCPGPSSTEEINQALTARSFGIIHDLYHLAPCGSPSYNGSEVS